MKTYEFPLIQPTTDMLQWIAGQAQERMNTSPVFYKAVFIACSDEIRRRENKLDDPHVVLSIPWILEDKSAYLEACIWACLSMLTAHEQSNLVLRNLFDLIREILFDQLDQGIKAAQEQAGPSVH